MARFASSFFFLGCGSFFNFYTHVRTQEKEQKENPRKVTRFKSPLPLTHPKTAFPTQFISQIFKVSFFFLAHRAFFRKVSRKRRSRYTSPPLCFFAPQPCPPFLADSHCVTLCSFCVSRWKLGTPNYGGLSVIMYLAAKMYRRSVPPWKKRAPNINWGILLLRSISMFLTLKVSPADLCKYLRLLKKRKLTSEKKCQYENYSCSFLAMTIHLKKKKKKSCILGKKKHSILSQELD